MIDLKEILTVFMTLFAVIDILGSLPVIVDLRKKMGHIQSEQASLVALALMVVFLYTGETILHFVGIDVPSFAVAGSFVLFLIALEMIMGIEIAKGLKDPKSGSIVPIAFPLIAGAGTLTTLISLKAEYQTINILIAVILNVLVVYLVLKSSGKLAEKLGSTGINIIKRVFGIILMAIALKLFANNINYLF